MKIQYLPLHWPQYHQLVEKLALKIMASSSVKLDKIIGISRCGLTLGHSLSDLLQLPVSVFTIQSYTDVQVQGRLRITEKLASPIKDKNILLVDGVADSGKTLLLALKYLKKLRPKTMTTATIFYKPHSRYQPDFFVQKTKKWVILPYEFIEYGCLAAKKLPSLDNFFKKNSYTPQQISFVRKHHFGKRP